MTPIDGLSDAEATSLFQAEALTVRCGEGIGNALREACRVDLSRPNEDLRALLALVS